MDERGGSGVFEKARKAGLGVALFLAGCATPAAKPAEVADRERLLLTLRAQNAAYVHRIEELQNRIFILEDRLDSRRVDAERRAAPELPPPAVVTLSPRPRPAEPAASVDVGSAPADEASVPVPASGGEPAASSQESPRPLTRAQQRAAARAMRKQVADLKDEERRREKERWGEDVPDHAPAALKVTKSGASKPASRPSRLPQASATTLGPSAPEDAGDEPEVPDGPTLSIETPVDYVGDAALSTARPVLRLSATETAAPTATRPRPRPLAEKTRPLVLYQEALEALHAGDHARAVASFRRFLALHPHHDYADNAQYWMGECFYDQGDYVHATTEFRRVVERYPRGNKVPDAMLKLGYALAATGDVRGASKVLSSLTKAFPRHAAAALAAERLASGGRAVATPLNAGRPATVAGASLKAQAFFGPAPATLALPPGASEKGQR